MAKQVGDSRSFAYWMSLPLCFFVILLPFCFLGYGSDNDTYGVLDCGRYVWKYHLLRTSRTPGYWTFEAMIYVLNRLGGSVLTNLAALVVASVLLWRCVVVAERLGARYPRTVVACIAAIPVYAIAACSTMDYLWPALGLLVMMECAVADAFVPAALAATFAYMIRGSDSIVIMGAVAGAMAAEWLQHRRWTPRATKVLAAGVFAGVVGSLPMVASYYWAGRTFQFTHGMIGPDAMWTMKLRVGRFGLKTLTLLGPAAWGVLACLAVRWWRVGGKVRVAERGYAERMVPLLLGAVCGNLLLFFKFPIEVSYLLPGAICLVLLLGRNMLAQARWMTLVFLAAVLSANVLTLQMVVPNVPGQATGAQLKPGLVRGQFTEEVEDRWILRGCKTHACIVHVLHPELPSQATPYDQ